MFPEMESNDSYFMTMNGHDDADGRGWAQDNDMDFEMFQHQQTPDSPPYQPHFIDFLEHGEFS